MITLPKQQLAAALMCAAVKDVRHYLKGVLFEVTTSGQVYLVGTTGASMFVGAPAANCSQKGPFQLIIPSDVIKAATKGKGDVTLECVDGDAYRLGDTMFKPEDGRYPDWRRVSSNASCEPAAGDYDFELLQQANKALQAWGGYKSASKLTQYGTQKGVMRGENPDAFVVVMPRTCKDENWTRMFTREAY